MPQYQHLKSTSYSDALLEVISNQLQVLAIQNTWEGLRTGDMPQQIKTMQLKIVEQRNELGIAIGGR